MLKHVAFRILSGLVLLAVIAAVAAFAFNAGMARGAALNLQAPATGQPMPYYGYGMPYMHPPFFGFGFFGLLVPLFLLFLVFGAVRRMMWVSHGGWRNHMMHHGPWGEKGPGSQDFVPPMFAEWHRRAHGEPGQASEPAEKPQQ